MYSGPAFLESSQDGETEGRKAGRITTLCSKVYSDEEKDLQEKCPCVMATAVSVPEFLLVWETSQSMEN